MIREALITQLACTHVTVQKNLEGVDHEASVRTPEGGGNSINWVVGHIVSTRGGILKLLGAEPVMGARGNDLYARRSKPIGPQDDCEPFEELRRLLDESQRRITEHLQAVEAAQLGRTLPGEAETAELVGQQLAVLVFHDAYHAGQLGAIRRAIGMAGAIA